MRGRSKEIQPQLNWNDNIFLVILTEKKILMWSAGPSEGGPTDKDDRLEQRNSATVKLEL